jgi:hypothetical protein
LRRIANDPNHPNRQAAIDAIGSESAGQEELMRARLQDPATNPNFY